jgi:hypothetical protein
MGAIQRLDTAGRASGVVQVRRRVEPRRMEPRLMVRAGKQNSWEKTWLVKTLHGMAFKRRRRQIKSCRTKQRKANNLRSQRKALEKPRESS